MLKTMNRSEWKEDPVETRLREGLSPQSNPILVKRLYPLRGKLIRFCRIHQLPIGTIMEHIRTKQEPAYYPLEVLVVKDGRVYKSSYNSEEIELMPPE